MRDALDQYFYHGIAKASEKQDSIYQDFQQAAAAYLKNVRDTGNLLKMAEQTGFTILRQEDQTLLWREYYLEAIWNDSFCCEEYKLLQKEYKGKKLRYTMLVGRKE